MLRKILFVSVAFVALFAADQTQAACKVKSEVGSESTTNKIQDAPKKRLNNKLLFDVVPNKNATAYNEDEEADLN